MKATAAIRDGKFLAITVTPETYDEALHITRLAGAQSPNWEKVDCFGWVANCEMKSAPNPNGVSDFLISPRQ